MTSPDATLQTDTIHFDRNIQQAFYNTKGTIINKDNTLVSKSGRYYAKEKKFQFYSILEVELKKELKFLLLMQKLSFFY